MPRVRIGVPVVDARQRVPTVQFFHSFRAWGGLRIETRNPTPAGCASHPSEEGIFFDEG